MKHVVFDSGGIASYIVVKRVAAKYGTENLIRLFTDTKSEDTDLYRFRDDTFKVVGGERVDLCDGRNLWELFNDEGMIANPRVDICSRILKRDIATKYLHERFPGGVGCTLYFGIDHSERDRFYGTADKTVEHRLPLPNGVVQVRVETLPGTGKAGIRRRWLPFIAEAPLCEPPYLSKCDMLNECERDGIDPPRLYDLGAKHNNCGGMCVKAGHAQFLWMLTAVPDVFDKNANEEEAFRVRTGKDVAIMKDRRGGVSKPLPMLEFKRQVESGELVVNPRDWGKGCQCMTPDEDAVS